MTPYSAIYKWLAAKDWKLLRDRIFGCDETPDKRYYFTERLFYPTYSKIADFFDHVDNLAGKYVSNRRTTLDNLIIRYNRAFKLMAYWKWGLFKFARVNCDCCSFIRVNLLCLLILLIVTMVVSHLT